MKKYIHRSFLLLTFVYALFLLAFPLAVNAEPVVYQFDTLTRTWDTGYAFNNISPGMLGAYVVSYNQYAWLQVNGVDSKSTYFWTHIYFYDGEQWVKTSFPQALNASVPQFFRLAPAYPRQEKDSAFLWASNNACATSTRLHYQPCVSLFDGKTWSTPTMFPKALNIYTHASDGYLFAVYPTAKAKNGAYADWVVSVTSVDHPETWTLPVALGDWTLDTWGQAGRASQGVLQIIAHSKDKHNSALLAVSPNGQLTTVKVFANKYLDQIRIAGDTTFLRGYDTNTSQQFLIYRYNKGGRWTELVDPFQGPIDTNFIGWSSVRNNTLCGISGYYNLRISDITCVLVNRDSAQQIYIELPVIIREGDFKAELSPDGKALWLDGLKLSNGGPYAYYYNLTAKKWVDVTPPNLVGGYGALMPMKYNTAVAVGQSNDSSSDLYGYYYNGVQWTAAHNFRTSGAGLGVDTSVVNFNMLGNGDLVRGLSDENAIFAMGWK